MGQVLDINKYFVGKKLWCSPIYFFKLSLCKSYSICISHFFCLKMVALWNLVAWLERLGYQAEMAISIEGAIGLKAFSKMMKSASRHKLSHFHICMQHCNRYAKGVELILQ